MRRRKDLITTSLVVRAVTGKSQEGPDVAAMAGLVWDRLAGGEHGILSAVRMCHDWAIDPPILVIEAFQGSGGFGFAYLDMKRSGSPTIIVCGVVPAMAELPLPIPPDPHDSFAVQRAGVVGLPLTIFELFGGLACDCSGWDGASGREGWELDLDEIRTACADAFDGEYGDSPPIRSFEQE